MQQRQGGCFSVKLFRRVFARVAVAAVDLQGAIGHPAGGLTSSDFGHGGGAAGWFGAVMQPRCPLQQHASGIDVVTRRSGGGLMLLIPGEHLWLDVVIGSDDPLWTNDVQTSMNWLGSIWQRALAECGVTETHVAQGVLVADDLGQLVCFAGRGPGEVMGSNATTKYVGVSQRRTRDQARFQCTAYTAWDPKVLAALLAEPIEDATRLRDMVGIVPVAPKVLAARVFELISELD